MATSLPIARTVDLLDPSKNILHNMSLDEARATLARGNPEEIRAIEGHFALVARDGVTVRMCRTISRLMRYFIAKVQDGPVLLVSDRMDTIHQWLKNEGLHEQFHPSYTRMVPAHYVVEIRLVGCPDPNPTYRRFFTPARATLPADLDAIAVRYIRAAYDEIIRWIQTLPQHEPIGVCFSGGIDSGAIFVLTHHALLSLGMNPSRLKAFTLAVDGGGEDLAQARAFLKNLDLELFLEPIEVPAAALDCHETIRVIEDYKPLDVQSAAMNLALLRAIRARYPNWKYLLDGDGGDENLKDYPIEENHELTVTSVLNNRLLYQEGWGVDSIKHSLTYSGGQSRGYARCYAPAAVTGFSTLSPYTALPVIEAAEAIPFVELTDWNHERLYALKGEVVSRGVKAVTGLSMPVYHKRRFQHGAARNEVLTDRFPNEPAAYRRLFHALHE